jgi:hypothetical protein
VLDRLATLVEPVVVTGDVNIRLERSADVATIQFIDMLSACDLAPCTASATHNLVGMLNVVAVRADMQPVPVDVIHVGISDHWLLRWTGIHTAISLLGGANSPEIRNFPPEVDDISEHFTT